MMTACLSGSIKDNPDNGVRGAGPWQVEMVILNFKDRLAYQSLFRRILFFSMSGIPDKLLYRAAVYNIKPEIRRLS